MTQLTKEGQGLYDSLARTRAGFSKPQAVREAEAALLAAINASGHPTLRDRIELACAALGAVSAGVAITTVQTVPPGSFEVVECDVCDALVERVSFWLRENYILHMKAEAARLKQKKERK